MDATNTECLLPNMLTRTLALDKMAHDRVQPSLLTKNEQNDVKLAMPQTRTSQILINGAYRQCLHRLKRPTSDRLITVDYTLLVLRFFMCNARALKVGIAASNVPLKPNAEYLEHN